MSNTSGKLTHSLQAGTSWMNAYENKNQQIGNTYPIVTLNHSYQDSQTGEWKPTNRYSVNELVDLHCLTGEMLSKLRVKDHSLTTEQSTNQSKETKGKFTEREVAKKAAKKAAKKTSNQKEIG